MLSRVDAIPAFTYLGDTMFNLTNALKTWGALLSALIVASFAAHAQVRPDCTIKIFVGGKGVESKLDLKSTEPGIFEAEKDDYRVNVALDQKPESFSARLSVQDKTEASGMRSVSNYVGANGTKPKTLKTALDRQGGGKVALLSCNLK